MDYETFHLSEKLMVALHPFALIRINNRPNSPLHPEHNPKFHRLSQKYNQNPPRVPKFSREKHRNRPKTPASDKFLPINQSERHPGLSFCYYKTTARPNTPIPQTCEIPVLRHTQPPRCARLSRNTATFFIFILDKEAILPLPARQTNTLSS